MASNAGRKLLHGKGVSNAAKIPLRRKGKAKIDPTPSSHLGKFLGIPEPPSSDIPKLISNFIKLHVGHGRGLKKEGFPMDKLKAFLSGKDSIGTPEIAKLLSQFQFKRF
ncbi:hypothetical protein SLA2020_457460 [Shorea laevis]